LDGGDRGDRKKTRKKVESSTWKEVLKTKRGRKKKRSVGVHLRKEGDGKTETKLRNERGRDQGLLPRGNNGP